MTILQHDCYLQLLHTYSSTTTKILLISKHYIFSNFPARLLKKNNITPRTFKFMPEFQPTNEHQIDKNFNLKHFFQPIKRQHTNKYLMLVISNSCKKCRGFKFSSHRPTLVRRKARKKLKWSQLKIPPTKQLLNAWLL